MSSDATGRLSAKWDIAVRACSASITVQHSMVDMSSQCTRAIPPASPTARIARVNSRA